MSDRFAMRIPKSHDFIGWRQPEVSSQGAMYCDALSLPPKFGGVLT
jgi:hypothetical protein